MSQNNKEAAEPDESSSGQKAQDTTGGNQGQNSKIIGNGSMVPLIRLSDVTLQPPEYVVEPLIERDSTTVIFGESESGKSLFTIDLNLSVAAGIPFHGFKVATCATVYFCGEGLNAFKRREVAWGIEHDIDLKAIDAPFFINKLGVDLLDAAFVDAVMYSLDEVAKIAGPPGIITFDTLSQTQGGDESGTADMTKYFKAIHRIKQKYSASVLVNHHSGHSDKERTRGSIVIKNNPDSQLRFTKDENDLITIENIRQRDGPKFAPLSFRIVQHELGIFMPDSGKPVTSVALRRAFDVVPDKKNESNKAGNGKWQQVALKALTDLWNNALRINKESGKEETEEPGIELSNWKDACLKVGIHGNRFDQTYKPLVKSGKVVCEYNTWYRPND